MHTLEDRAVARAARAERPRRRQAAARRAARRRPLRAQPRDRRVHPHRRGDQRHRRRRDGARRGVTRAARRPVPRHERDRLARAALQPGRDRRRLGRSPSSTGWWFLLALLALQLALGLTLGRRWCLPCLAYFELVQPRFGEGKLEDSRPPRAANIVGLAVLAAASIAYAARLRRSLGAALGAARRRARAARRRDRLLHRLRGVQARSAGVTGKPFVSCPIPEASLRVTLPKT